ncbi:MAG: hypothetical protein ACFB2Y_16855 [Fulvivirga sp.]
MSYPIYVPMITGKTAEAIDDEISKAKEVFTQNFNSTHEAYAVLKEEVDELWDEVKHGEKRELERCDSIESAIASHKGLMRKEAIQVAAMAIRFINELT